MTLDYRKILHFIFPPSDDELLIENTSKEDLLQITRIQENKEVLSLLPYSDKRVRSAVHLLKFHNHTHAKRLLSAVFTQYLETVSDEDLILIPIPLSTRRLRERGYNQVTELISESLKEKAPGDLQKNILIRKRHTIPQTSLPREKRLKNLTGAFSIKNEAAAIQALAGKHILLIDDVTTTGATLQVAKSTLLSLSPASITCVALAH